MSRIYDAIENSRALAPVGGRLPARPPRLGGAAADAADLPLLRLWQAVETRLADRPRKVVQIVPCGRDEADPGVAVRLARLAGRSMGGGVVVLNDLPGDQEEGGTAGEVAFWPLPGKAGDVRALNPDLLRACWRKLGERAELVVADTPPLQVSPLSLAMAPTVDGVILLVEAERTRAEVARAARDMLLACGANILGVVLNKRRFHIPRRLYDRL